MKSSITSIGIFLVLGACVDRLHFDIKKSNDYGIAVDGFISDQPGPYQIRINRAFDIESTETIKTPVTVSHLTLSDNKGTTEELTEIDAGIYETSVTGIRGQVGRVYTLRIELTDGKIYESIPDTLLPTGIVDSLYYSYTSLAKSDGATDDGFDIFFNASRGNGGRRFMWKMTGTFQAETHPERDNLNCYFSDGKCNYAPLCSGLLNIGSSGFRNLVRVKPCECCTCWYKIFNTKPELSDERLNSSGNYSNIRLYRIPVTPWIFAHKIHVQVSQISLTNNSFRFWKAIRDQRNAIGSIFQPVTGKIPVNFVQLNGSGPPILGLFYATSISSSKPMYITRDNVPHPESLPTLDYLANTYQIGFISCLNAFPNATNVKPAFWSD